MIRTIRIGYFGMNGESFDIEVDDEDFIWGNEDELYEEIVNEVLNTIQIEIL